MPISGLLADGYDLAYVPKALVEHHTVTSLSDFLSKFGPRISKRFVEHDQPIWQRSRKWSFARRVRAYLWPIYSVSIVFPTIVAIYGAIRDARVTWLYHPVISFALGVEFWRRFFKWRFDTTWKSRIN